MEINEYLDEQEQDEIIENYTRTVKSMVSQFNRILIATILVHIFTLILSGHSYLIMIPDMILLAHFYYNGIYLPYLSIIVSAIQIYLLTSENKNTIEIISTILPFLFSGSVLYLEASEQELGLSIDGLAGSKYKLKAA